MTNKTKQTIHFYLRLLLVLTIKIFIFSHDLLENNSMCCSFKRTHSCFLGGIFFFKCFSKYVKAILFC